MALRRSGAGQSSSSSQILGITVVVMAAVVIVAAIFKYDDPQDAVKVFTSLGTLVGLIAGGGAAAAFGRRTLRGGD